MNHNKKKFWVKLVAIVIIAAMLISLVASAIAVIMSMNNFPMV